MKRPKSAQLLSTGVYKFNSEEFQYHRLLIHNRPASYKDQDKSDDPFLVDIINHGPSYLQGNCLFQPGPGPLMKGEPKRLTACKRLNIRHFLGVTKKIRRIKAESCLIEAELENSPVIKVPNAKLIIAHINSSFNQLMRRGISSNRLNASMLRPSSSCMLAR